MTDFKALHAELKQEIASTDAAAFYVWACENEDLLLAALETAQQVETSKADAFKCSQQVTEHHTARLKAEAESASLKAERDKWKWHFETLVRDTGDGFECLPECDSFGHKELCPATNPAEAWRQLRDQLGALQAQLAAKERELEIAVSQIRT